MSNVLTPELPDYEEIEKQLESERKTIIRVNNFSDDDEYVRTVSDAKVVLDFVKDIQKELGKLFEEFPSLTSVFSHEYISFHNFVQRDSILDVIFLDDCLIPEKEAFFFGQDGGIEPGVLDLHRNSIGRWISEKRQKHESTQKFILEDFNLETKAKDLKCQCTKCTTDYRAKLREYIFNSCKNIIEEARDGIENNINLDIDTVSDIYQQMQKNLDKTFYKVRFRLKRSSLNRLEVQIKNIIKDSFHYPSEMAVLHSRNVRMYCDELLDSLEYPQDLITEEEFMKLFKQLQSNLWKGKGYLRKEFKKFVKSIVVLKKERCFF